MFFDDDTLWSENDSSANKNGSINTSIYVIVGLNLNKFCLVENNVKMCYLLPDNFDILSKEIDLANLEKEEIKTIDLIDGNKFCDIRFDSYIPNRNMDLDFKPYTNFEISNCKKDVKISISAENYIDELEYELIYSGVTDYAYIAYSDIAYEEAFIGLYEGISSKIWYNINYNPINVISGKEYKPKFIITISDLNGNVVQEEEHFVTMTTYGEVIKIEESDVINLEDIESSDEKIVLPQPVQIVEK